MFYLYSIYLSCTYAVSRLNGSRGPTSRISTFDSMFIHQTWSQGPCKHIFKIPFYSVHHHAIINYFFLHVTPWSLFLFVDLLLSFSPVIIVNVTLWLTFVSGFPSSMQISPWVLCKKSNDRLQSLICFCTNKICTKIIKSVQQYRRIRIYNIC